MIGSQILTVGIDNIKDMKKVALSMVLVAVMVFTGAFSVAEASSSLVTINKYMGYGSQGAEVIKLQQYLINMGYLRIGFATGNYLSLTTKAVKVYQLSEGIESTGYFGPLTQASMNGKIVAMTDAPKASIANLAIADNTGKIAKTIKWQTDGYTSNAGVNINLLKKTSVSPANYELVRNIATNTPNTGSMDWTPTSTEIGTSDLYLEVTCTPEAEYGDGCHISGAPIRVS